MDATQAADFPTIDGQPITKTPAASFAAFRQGSLDGGADASDGVYLPTWSNPWIDEDKGTVRDHELASAYADGYTSAHAAIPARW